jgi:hypothetical protein
MKSRTRKLSLKPDHAPVFTLTREDYAQRVGWWFQSKADQDSLKSTQRFGTSVSYATEAAGPGESVFSV